MPANIKGNKRRKLCNRYS